MCPSTENSLRIYFRIIDIVPIKHCFECFSTTAAKFGNIERQVCIYSVNYSWDVCGTLYQNSTFFLEKSLFDVGWMKEVACTLAFLMMTQFVHGLSILQCKISPSFLNPPENWNSSCPLLWLVTWPRFYRLETLWRFCFGFSIRTLPRLSWFCWIVESPGWRDLEVDYPQTGNPGNARTSLMPCGSVLLFGKLLCTVHSQPFVSFLCGFLDVLQCVSSLLLFH